MALQVWLPLDGTLRNKGCLSPKVVNYGAEVDASGKIGSCYSFNGANSYISITDSAIYPVLSGGSQPFSITMWIYRSDATRAILFGDYNLSPVGKTNFINVELSTSDLVLLYVGSASASDLASNDSVVQNAWNHIAITYDGTTIKCYLNGVLSTTVEKTVKALTKASGAYYLGRDSRTGTTAFEGKMNDFRIYDHCLSHAEVREVARGLVLHYKLDSSSLRLNWLEPYAERIATRGTSNVFLDYPYNSELINCPDTNYIVEFDAYGTADDMYVDAYFRGSGGAYAYTSKTLITTYWKHYALSLTGDPANLTIFRFRCYKGTDGDEFHVKNLRLSSGTMPVGDAPVIDSSGYGHHGSIYGTLTTSADTPRYDSCVYFDGSSAINAGKSGKLSDSLTVSMWINYSTIGNPVSCQESGGFVFRGSSVPVMFRAYVNGGYKDAAAPAQPSANEWHMFTGVHDRLNQAVRFYIDGAKVKETSTGSTAGISYHASNVVFIGAEAGSNATTPASNFLIGYISDFRIYSTPLSDDDILDLYQTAVKIDKLGNMHACEIQEADSVSIKKTGIVKAIQFNELAELIKLKYDLKTYIEPDGSVWVRVFHHNNPAEGQFNTTDDFENSVYLDENRWFNMGIANNMTIWEIMVKQKTTVTATESKYRWIQTANPMTATYNDVSYGSITKITTSEYTSLPDTYGGIYKKDSSTVSYLMVNNNTASNTWGRVGSMQEYQGGIAGWNKFIVTTGYLDVYLRIDNQVTAISTAKISKNKRLNANAFYER